MRKTFILTAFASIMLLSMGLTSCTEPLTKDDLGDLLTRDQLEDILGVSYVKLQNDLIKAYSELKVGGANEAEKDAVTSYLGEIRSYGTRMGTTYAVDSYTEERDKATKEVIELVRAKKGKEVTMQDLLDIERPYDDFQIKYCLSADGGNPVYFQYNNTHTPVKKLTTDREICEYFYLKTLVFHDKVDPVTESINHIQDANEPTYTNWNIEMAGLLSNN